MRAPIVDTGEQPHADDVRLKAMLEFDAAVTHVRAVSSARAAALGKMNISSVRDLLTHYPRRYIDMSQMCTVADATIGDTCTIVGRVLAVKLKRPKPRLSLVEITLNDGTETLMITCFRQPWLADKLHVDDTISVAGAVEFNYGFKRMTNPFLEVMESGMVDRGGIVISVHPATEKVPTAMMRRLMANALEITRALDDPLPLDLRLRYRLPSRYSALRAIHLPDSMDEVHGARRRLVYEELLLLQLYMMRQKRQRYAGNPAIRHTVDGEHVKALEAALPFELTAEQRTARDELFAAMAADDVARHMLLGDVGTGKTAVAAFGLAAVADSGTQALMMAPTEVLADQYAVKIGPLLDAAGVKWALLSGSTEAADRTAIIERIAAADLDVVFGTHALLEDDVRPARCSLVVIDEQQRFGVAQRDALVAKGAGSADLLSMTATPIPRSLALALFGDMTLSYIHERPNATAGNTTQVFPRSVSGGAYDVARRELSAGHQVYIVCPLVGSAGDADEAAKKNAAGKPSAASADDDGEYAYARISIESESDIDGSDAKAAAEHAAFLQRQVFTDYRVDVLHGRMSGQDKRDIMHRFAQGDIDVLVSTTVIEVGVDVPNATVMIVEDADRFGLAQLHQLRGRVGRGDAPGHTCLVSATQAPPALSRLEAMTKTEDGFELAEYDLSLRREGDILGNRQHGASILKLVNIVRDSKTIAVAHDDAAALIAADPNLEQPEHRALARELDIVFADYGSGIR